MNPDYFIKNTLASPQLSVLRPNLVQKDTQKILSYIFNRIFSKNYSPT
ncbi:hypothetical protein MACJ_003762 [Theileria orientalis]|uniref:Uncharacterized protein n=1 Tax=Theileria orientalis TaxID=68886 RepID=A0A976SKJ2_THEOR|nr:hypothetical protein MACJ_003762 [Theileria orientalis]